MRIVIHHYADGTRYAYETTEDGEYLRDIEGQRRPGKRIRAAIEVECDDSDDGRSAALADLELAREELAKAV